MDDTKSRFKGTISLDKDLCPMLIVKNYDSKKKSPKHVYLSLKIGKRTYQFTADSFRELKEWSALLRQAIDNGEAGKRADVLSQRSIVRPLIESFAAWNFFFCGLRSRLITMFS